MIPKTSVWVRAQTIQLSIAEEITPGFNIGFDKKIPETTQSELRAFVEWIENNYRIPITFWVDFDCPFRTKNHQLSWWNKDL